MMRAELYVCWKCEFVELERFGSCPTCGGEMECVDFVPEKQNANLLRALKKIEFFLDPDKGVGHRSWHAALATARAAIAEAKPAESIQEQK